MERFFWVCLAGAAGTAVRYLISLWATERFGTSFPYGTLIVNVSGCFLLGLVMQVALSFGNFPPTLRVALSSGFMGGLTTYSSFNYESTRLLFSTRQAGIVNLLATLVLCFAAGLLGIALGRRLAD